MRNKLAGIGKQLAPIALFVFKVLLIVLGFRQRNKAILGFGMILLGSQLAIYGWQELSYWSNVQPPSAMHDPDGYRDHRSTEGFYDFIMCIGAFMFIGGIMLLILPIKL
jgi:hypothetical protein